MFVSSLFVVIQMLPGSTENPSKITESLPTPGTTPRDTFPKEIKSQFLFTSRLYVNWIAGHLIGDLGAPKHLLFRV